MVAQRTSADGGEPINALAEIHRLRGHKEPTLRSELEHEGVSKKVRSRVARGRGVSEECIRSRAPSRRWRAISVPGVGTGQAAGVATSTTPRGVEGAAAAGGEGGAVQRFFNVPQLTPSPWATRDTEKTVVTETACSHNGRGIGPEGVGRRWRQSAKHAAHWVRACSVCAVPWGRVTVFLSASKSDDVLGDTVSCGNLRCHACSPEAHV
jgi:hypothetical protein